MVFRRLFASKKTEVPKLWQAPDGVRIYAIGDIHGECELLETLLRSINADNLARGSGETRVIFLGDLMDRGPDSRGVIERLIRLGQEDSRVRFLKGNHEELLIKTWEGDRRAAAIFNRAGGRETMLSYGVSSDDYDAATLEELTQIVADHVPRDHINFIDGFGDWILEGDYLFVHAGIRPGVALDDQAGSDLRWIRREFTEYTGNFGHCVVHGHTITPEVDEQPNRIGIDTGAFATGKLTAIGIEGTDHWFLST